MNTKKSAFDVWTELYTLKRADYHTGKTWPSETLLRLLNGNYIPGQDKNYAGKKVLDLGFGNGNNMILLGSLGFDLYGIEVTEEICQVVKSKMAELKYDADLRAGTNTCIPFEDNMFDLLISWNVIHYEDNEDSMRKAISECQRVLKPGGRVLISTTGPEHKILRNSKSAGKHLYQILRQDDHRKGEVFYYFDTEENIKRLFEPLFKDVLIGRVTDFLMTEKLDSYLITGVK